jgi:phytoene dehydrogenase-like protein
VEIRNANLSPYDGIVIGAGHNGLILAAYLAKAGLRVLAVDRLETAGPADGVGRIRRF